MGVPMTDSDLDPVRAHAMLGDVVADADAALHVDQPIAGYGQARSTTDASKHRPAAAAA